MINLPPPTIFRYGFLLTADIVEVIIHGTLTVFTIIIFTRLV